MSRPPNPYRDQHRHLEALGNQASNKGNLSLANFLWREAAKLKRQGIKELEEQLDRKEGRT